MYVSILTAGMNIGVPTSDAHPMCISDMHILRACPLWIPYTMSTRFSLGLCSPTQTARGRPLSPWSQLHNMRCCATQIFNGLLAANCPAVFFLLSGVPPTYRGTMVAHCHVGIAAFQCEIVPTEKCPWAPTVRIALLVVCFILRPEASPWPRDHPFSRWAHGPSEFSLRDSGVASERLLWGHCQLLTR